MIFDDHGVFLCKNKLFFNENPILYSVI